MLTVNVAVAFPFASKVTELGATEQVGADFASCTEHVSATELLNPFDELRVIFELELWPRVMIAGMDADAKIENDPSGTVALS